MKKIITVLVLLFCSHQIYAQQDTIPVNKKDTIFINKQDTTIIPSKPDTLQNRDTLNIDSVRIDSSEIYRLKPDGKSLKGIASFYSKNLDGTKTATGERYRNNKLTAASNNFKLNTWVKVTNLRNGKSVIVRINDRMHPRMAKRGRVVDLSRAAAAELDFMKNGLVKVKVEVVELKIVD
ncbi:MAG: septal ring lytic transglycosylase RlpA family protein [Chitinophagaceae bacterium]|nr:septal ring lytic transglycosylase RlpA family protein [Chitinophagaceae bacterium]